VLSYGVHDLQESGILPGEHALAFDVSAAIPPDSWYGTLLKGTLNFSPDTTWLSLLTWLAYTATVLTIFLVASNRNRAGRSIVAPRVDAATMATTAR